jgi:asparagine synthase (glutamine-hydrolysing)
MCGIAGIVGSVTPEDVEAVRAMNAIQSYRGPDADGVELYPGAVLGAVRLAVIDLSPRSEQPMKSHCGRYAMTYNGEIYNYRELRSELDEFYPFRTESDTEVLLAAYVTWGSACLERLEGMFAFCVHDVVSRQVFLARDRFGQKPLHYCEIGGRLLFASEIKALLAAGCPSQPDLATWSRYLVAASYDDTESTFFAGVRQLRPGECATWCPDQGLQRKRYYVLSERIRSRDMTVTDSAEAVRELMLDAVGKHMRSDVTVGVSLSGGLDSSALLACIGATGGLQEGVNCISVDFGQDFTEEKWIRAAASHYDLGSEVCTFTPDAFRDSIAPLMWHLEAPIGGLMNCALELVMGTARARGITVLQDGTGLDELFAGYRNHHDLYLGLLLEQNDPSAAVAVKEYAENWGVSEERAREAARQQLSNPGSAIDGTVPVRPDLLDPDFIEEYPVEGNWEVGSGDRLRDALVDYMQVRKVPRNTRFKDRLSMAHSIELRLPFLDHRLAEFALSLPASHYFLHGRSKSIVREAMTGIMDDTVRNASKRSIQAPQGNWLKTEPMRTYINRLLHSDQFASRGIFDPQKCQREFARFCATDYDNSFFVWQWINVEEWFRVFVDGDPVRYSGREAKT